MKILEVWTTDHSCIFDWISIVRSPNQVITHLKSTSKMRIWLFVHLSYAPQTKILDGRTFGNAFSKYFANGEYSIWAANWATFLWKVLRKCVPKCSFGHPKSSFGEHNLLKSSFGMHELGTKDHSIPAVGNSPPFWTRPHFLRRHQCRITRCG